MSHYWSQASANDPYTPRLIPYLSGSPRGLSDRMGSNVRAMKIALDVLVEHEVIASYKAKRITEGKKLVDIYYTIFPTDKFVKTVKRANYKSNSIRLKKDLHTISETSL
tara:strand:- start:1064 stop:1390 length:327 start_codon:yes stop_codon:yes gene_type:complete